MLLNLNLDFSCISSCITGFLHALTVPAKQNACCFPDMLLHQDCKSFSPLSDPYRSACKAQMPLHQSASLNFFFSHPSRSVIFNRCATRIFKIYNIWTLSQGHWPLYLRVSDKKVDNSRVSSGDTQTSSLRHWVNILCCFLRVFRGGRDDSWKLTGQGYQVLFVDLE